MRKVLIGTAIVISLIVGSSVGLLAANSLSQTFALDCVGQSVSGGVNISCSGFVPYASTTTPEPTASPTPTPTPTPTPVSTSPYAGLTYTSNFEGVYAVYQMDEQGQAVRLTDLDAENEYPAWNPSCDKLLIHSFRDYYRNIYLDGQPVTANQYSDAWPRFISNGQRVLWASDRDGTWDEPVNADGSNRENGNWELYHANLDGTGRVRLTYNDFDDRWPDASITDRLTFSSNREGYWRVYVRDDQGNDVAVSPEGIVSNYSRWSPDGQTLAFQLHDTAQGWQIWLVAPDGSNLRRVQGAGGNMFWPGWSPDGQILYSSDKTGSYELFIGDASPVQITSHGAHTFAPDWCRP